MEQQEKTIQILSVFFGKEKIPMDQKCNGLQLSVFESPKKIWMLRSSNGNNEPINEFEDEGYWSLDQDI